MRTIDWVGGKIRIIDQTRDGDATPIELQSASGMLEINGTLVAPENTQAYNPAFDITPVSLVSPIVTELGAVRPGVGDLRALIDSSQTMAKAGLSGDEAP